MRFLKQNLFLLLLLLGSNTYAATLYVKHDATGTNNGTSWTNAYTDLQVAMNAAAVNDEIWVAAGTYRPNQKPTGVTAADNRLKTFYLKKNIKLYGGFVGTETALSQRDAVLNLTILSGDVGTVGVVTDNSYHVFITKDLTAAAVIDGFTIKDGSSQNYTTSSMTYSFHTYNSHYGAGFYNAGSSPTLTNIIVSNNWASYNGGGFYNFSSSPTISNSTINNNTATHGGGIYNNTLSSPVLNNVTISSNTASSLGGGVNNTSSSTAPTFTNVTVINNTAANGGGFYNFSSSPTFNNVIVNNNSASSTGGGFYNYSCSSIINNVTVNNNTAHIGGGIYNSTASPILTNVTINNNSTSSHGGAFANFSSSTPTLTNVTVNNNISSGYGAAFYNSQSSPTLTNVVISNNTSSSYGGGFHNYSSSPILTNITMTNNSAPFGGGFYNSSSSSPVIKNSIIWNNGSSEVLNSSSTPTFYYSIIKGSGGSSAWLSSFGIDGGNNLATDPLFVSSTDFSLQNSSPAINAGNNTYNTTVTDLAGSTRIQGTNIDMGAYEAIFMTATATPVSCYGGANGTITLTLSNAGNYTFLWNDGDTAQNRTNLIAGTYIVTVTGNSGIVGNDTIIVNQPLVDLTVSAIAPNVSCNGNNDGFINLVVNGGTSPYNYLWNDGSTLQNRTNLIAGTYTVTVTDANGCVKTVNANIVQPLVLKIVHTAVNVSCNGNNTGSINLTVSGGIAPYTYLWNNGSTTKNRTNLIAGTYKVTVTDANGCTKSKIIKILQPTVIVITPAITNVSCNNGTDGLIALTVTGGTAPYTYSWNDGSTIQNKTNLSVGTYTVTVTDANGCAKSKLIKILQPSALIIAHTATNVSCYNGTNGLINLTTTGGTAPYTYFWNDGITTPNRTNLIAGTYIITVTDANGCTKTKSITILQPTALTITHTVTNLSCDNDANGSISLTVNGSKAPYSYLWNDGNTLKNRTNLTEGIYTVTVTDANGCQKTDTAQIAAADTMIVTIDTTHVLCNSYATGAIHLNIVGTATAYTFAWGDDSTTSATRTNLLAGIYNVTVTNSSGCQKTFNIPVTQPQYGLTAAIFVFNRPCNGNNNGELYGSVIPYGMFSTGTPPYQYLWSTGDTTQIISNLATANYGLTVTDANGCTYSLSTNLLNCQGMALISNTNEEEVQESNEITIQQKDDVSATVLVYPNPANDLFHIVLNSFENEIAHIGIFSSLGILVYSKTTTEPTTVIPTNDWTNGIYHIQIRTGEKMETRTVLINH